MEAVINIESPGQKLSAKVLMIDAGGIFLVIEYGTEAAEQP